MTALMTIAFTLFAAATAWISVDDGVMGGRSASRAVRTGDGKRYRANLRTDTTCDSVRYQAGFTTVAGTWQDVRLDFAQFEPRSRGCPVPAVPALDPARIITFGLLIADRQAGPFRLEIDTITSVVADPP